MMERTSRIGRDFFTLAIEKADKLNELGLEIGSATLRNQRDYGERVLCLSTPFWDKICLLHNEVRTLFRTTLKNLHEISGS